MMLPRLRVLLVDDSAVMRRIISEALATDPTFELAGVASNGEIALPRITPLSPDAVSLDVEMLFTRSLAERLGRGSIHHFHEASQGQVIERGSVYIAPGGHHMEVERVGVHVRARIARWTGGAIVPARRRRALS
jgi:chemotaxis response regulator CheB